MSASLMALSINHHSAPLALRERVAFTPDIVSSSLRQLLSGSLVQEATILSTCNRTEIYYAAEHADHVVQWLANNRHVDFNELAPHVNILSTRDTVRHAFRVASGMDSMVLGEPQILGQIKNAVSIAQHVGALGSTLHKLFQHTFSVAKEVRSSTHIGANLVSMAAATVRLAERIFPRIADQTVLLIGAGDMISLCAAHLAAAHPRRILIANRHPERAQHLIDRYHAEYYPLSALSECLPEADIVVSCTASPVPLIGLGLVERAIKQRRHRPIFMVDLAVPRDIEAEAGQLDDVFLYTIDDLAQIVQEGLAARQSAVSEAESIVSLRVDDFMQWLEARQHVDLVRQLRQWGELITHTETVHALAALSRGEAPEQVIQRLARNIRNKLLHPPTEAVNRAATQQDLNAISILKKTFQLTHNDT